MFGRRTRRLHGQLLKSAAPLRSRAGHWLYFSLLEQWDIVEELPAEPDDQNTLAMLEALFFLTILRRFPDEESRREIGSFAERIAQTLAPENGLNQHEISTVIARGLASEASTPLFEHQALVNCYFQIVRQYTIDLKAGVEPVLALVASAERITLARGFTPMLYDASQT